MVQVEYFLIKRDNEYYCAESKSGWTKSLDDATLYRNEVDIPKHKMYIGDEIHKVTVTLECIYTKKKPKK
jgi:hypothetical protein